MPLCNYILVGTRGLMNNFCPFIFPNLIEKEAVFLRIIALLVNEAYDVLSRQIATRSDIERAMTLGVNYPKGLLAWGDELGLPRLVATLDGLREHYGEERYRVVPALRAAANQAFLL